MKPLIPTIQVWAIVPAAGVGRRMGAPKQIFPYGESTLTGQVVGTLLRAGITGVVVVTRPPLVAQLKLPPDPRVETAINDDADSQMIESIRIGLAHLADRHTPSPKDGMAVVPADMPALSADACRRCLDAYAKDPRRIVVASHRLRRGHPIIFPFALRAAVGGLPAGLNGLMRQYAHRVCEVETEDLGVTTDVDTCTDYDNLRSNLKNEGDIRS